MLRFTAESAGVPGLPASVPEKLGIPVSPLREQAIPRPAATCWTVVLVEGPLEAELQATRITHDKPANNERTLRVFITP